MQKKHIILALFVAIVVMALGVTVFLLSSPGSNEQNNTGPDDTPFPDIPAPGDGDEPTPTPATSTEPLPEKPLSEIQYQRLRTELPFWGEGSYTLSEESYQIAYNEYTKDLVIVLNRPPWAAARIEGEKKLMEITGNTPEELCSAGVVVSIPWWWADVPNARSVGLSFCPNSQEL